MACYTGWRSYHNPHIGTPVATATLCCVVQSTDRVYPGNHLVTPVERHRVHWLTRPYKKIEMQIDFIHSASALGTDVTERVRNSYFGRLLVLFLNLDCIAVLQ